LDTSDDDSGCWTPEPRPAARRRRAREMKPPTVHAAAVGRTQEPDLDERQPELRRPHGQQDIDDIREAVVKHVGAARHAEDGPAGGLHAPIIAGRTAGFK
jgi:hypothetical protein